MINNKQEKHSGDEIAIIGSGPAGMAAAFRLQQAGFKPRLFEMNDRVGGRTRTTRRDGFAFESGAVNIVSSFNHLLGIIAEAGLIDELVPCGSTVGIPRDGHLYTVDAEPRLRDMPKLLGLGLLSARSKLKLLRLAYDVFSARKQLSYDNLWQASDLDTESAADYAHRVLNEEIYDVVIDNVARGSAGGAAEQVSKADFFFGLAKWMGVSLMTMRDGMSSYAERMAERFDVELNTAVLAVEESGDGVLVTYQRPDGEEHTELMAGCIVAVPAAQSAKLVPQLDSWRADYLNNMIYAKGMVLSLAKSRPIDVPASLILTPKSSQPDVSCIHIPSNMAPWRTPQGKGLVTMIAAADMSARLIDASDEKVLSDMMAAMEQASPGITADTEWHQIDRWNVMLPLHQPGFTHELAQFKKLSDANDKRIQFAGDYWSMGCVETSTASGERAARALDNELRKGRG